MFNAVASEASGENRRGARDHRTPVCLVALPDMGDSTRKTGGLCSTYPSNHVETAAFIFHPNRDFGRAAPIVLCEKKKKRPFHAQRGEKVQCCP